MSLVTHDILSLIPQRPPFVMVNALLLSEKNITKTIFCVDAANPLLLNGELSEGGLVENIAQTAAAGAGYRAMLENSRVSEGYIGAIKNLEIFELPKIGDALITEVRIVEELADIIIISGTVKRDDTILAQCEMNIYTPKIKPAVFVIADNILSPLGSTTEENFAALQQGVPGIREHHDTALADEPFYAALFDRKIEGTDNKYSRFEQLLIDSLTDSLKHDPGIARDKKTVLIISSTKGNINRIEKESNSPNIQQLVSLPASAKLVADHFGFINPPVVISNACISGIMAIITGMRLIRSGQYDHAVIAGADLITKFILSGFQSFQAVSPGPCKPFDLNRDGISLGEGAASLILSAKQKRVSDVKVMGGAVSNDANHISAPSRTGEELCQAISRSLGDARLSATDIDFISAHGTATLYNDEMEAKAITMAGLRGVPVNSLKGFFGHTLGAAGLIESIICMHSLKENLVIPTLGFSVIGVPDPINISSKLLKGNFNNCLKTGSGFGGCNAAVVFSK